LRQVYMRIVLDIAQADSPSERAKVLDLWWPLAPQFFADVAKEYAKVVYEKEKVAIQTPPSASEGVEMCKKAILEACRRGERKRGDCLPAYALGNIVAERCAEYWLAALRSTMAKYSELSRPA